MQKYIDEISKKIVAELQPIFGDLSDVNDQSAAASQADVSANVIDKLHITASRYRKKLDLLSEEVNDALSFIGCCTCWMCE